MAISEYSYFQLSLLRKYHHDINMYIIKFQEILSVLLHRQGCYIYIYTYIQTKLYQYLRCNNKHVYYLIYIYIYTCSQKTSVFKPVRSRILLISSPCPLPRSRGLPCLPWRAWRLASDWEHGMPTLGTRQGRGGNKQTEQCSISWSLSVCCFAILPFAFVLSFCSIKHCEQIIAIGL